MSSYYSIKELKEEIKILDKSVWNIENNINLEELKLKDRSSVYVFELNNRLKVGNTGSIYNRFKTFKNQFENYGNFKIGKIAFLNKSINNSFELESGILKEFKEFREKNLEILNIKDLDTFFNILKDKNLPTAKIFKTKNVDIELLEDDINSDMNIEIIVPKDEIRYIQSCIQLCKDKRNYYLNKYNTKNLEIGKDDNCFEHYNKLFYKNFTYLLDEELFNEFSNVYLYGNFNKLKDINVINKENKNILFELDFEFNKIVLELISYDLDEFDFIIKSEIAYSELNICETIIDIIKGCINIKEFNLNYQKYRYYEYLKNCKLLEEK